MGDEFVNFLFSQTQINSLYVKLYHKGVTIAPYSGIKKFCTAEKQKFIEDFESFTIRITCIFSFVFLIF